MNKKKYKLGRAVMQTEDYYCIKAGRIGWVSDIWPQVRVLFEDGRETDVHTDLCEILKPLDEYCGDIETIRERIEKNKKKRRQQVIRKSTY